MTTVKKATVHSDEFYMRAALVEAAKAEKRGEVPVGAVIVCGGKIVGRGCNQSIVSRDPSAHAEIVALRKAAKKLKNYRLMGCKIYVTMEPCPMCAGALLWARIDEIIFGARDLKAGACGSVCSLTDNPKFNHRIPVTPDILEAECRKIVQDFFKARRKKK